MSRRPVRGVDARVGIARPSPALDPVEVCRKTLGSGMGEHWQMQARGACYTRPPDYSSLSARVGFPNSGQDIMGSRSVTRLQTEIRIKSGA